MRGARAQDGFTLLEVVVAFVVLALTLVTVFQVFSAGLSRAADLEEYSQALSLAQAKVAGVGVEETIKEGEMAGESKDRRYRWSVKVARHQEAAPATGQAAPATPQATFGLYRIDVRVGWRAADGRDRDVSLSTLQLGPANL